MDGNINYRQALTKAMAMCSQSERCRFDVAAKLRLWELSEEEISKAIEYLIKERFLNEERFVDFYVSDKLRFNKWGKIKLTYMLRQKQIPGELIRSALNRIDDDFYKKILQHTDIRVVTNQTYALLSHSSAAMLLPVRPPSKLL